MLELGGLAPVCAVLGNNDYPEYGESVGMVATPRIGGVRFLVTHTPTGFARDSVGPHKCIEVWRPRAAGGDSWAYPCARIAARFGRFSRRCGAVSRLGNASARWLETAACENRHREWRRERNTFRRTWVIFTKFERAFDDTICRGSARRFLRVTLPSIFDRSYRHGYCDGHCGMVHNRRICIRLRRANPKQEETKKENGV